MQIKKMFFMLNKFLTDISGPKDRYILAKDFHSKILGYYYFVFQEERVSTGKDQKLISKFDENGIPVNKTYIDVTEKEYVYFPISIGQMGLSIFHTYLKTKSESDKNRFLKFVMWFYENADKSDNLGVRWLTDVSLPQYKNAGPWQSAFAQSRGISILLRGYQITGDDRFAEMAARAIIPFTKPVSDGGIIQYTKWGPFYEEYISSTPTLVLNGMVFSLFGINDYIRVFPKNELANKIFDDGLKTLENILPEYDLGYWSRYNLCDADWYPKIDPATISYQRLHIWQLSLLWKLTNNDTFKHYADRFEEQIKLTNIIRMYIVKYSSLKKLNRL